MGRQAIEWLTKCATRKTYDNRVDIKLKERESRREATKGIYIYTYFFFFE